MDKLNTIKYSILEKNVPKKEANLAHIHVKVFRDMLNL